MKVEWSPVWFVLPLFLLVVGLLLATGAVGRLNLEVCLENTFELPRPELTRMEVFVDNEPLGNLIPNTKLTASFWVLFWIRPKELTVISHNENGYYVKDIIEILGDRAILTFGKRFEPQQGQYMLSVLISWGRG
jgi:hypothetical protein